MKVTKKQKEKLEIIAKAGGLFKYFNDRGTASYQILNSSTEIDKRMVKRLLKKGVLIPQQDGFFGESQVYKTIGGQFDDLRCELEDAQEVAAEAEELKEKLERIEKIINE